MAPIHPRLLGKDKDNKDKNKEKEKKEKNKRDGSREAVVARELLLARSLSGNEKKSRDKAVFKLRKWLQIRSQSTYDFTEHDFLRLWKGLFYCVWMSDKPLVQEELCDNIAGLFECFGARNLSSSVLFYRCFLKTLAADWFGIDQHRIDKFLMMVRRVTRGMLRCLKRAEWSEESTDLLDGCLSGDGGLFCPDAPGEARMALGLQLHLVDCWTEEVAKVGDGKVPADAVVRLMRPFAVYLSNGKEPRLASSIMKHIFIQLISQTDVGLEYQMKTRAWFKAGFPGGSADAMEKVELSDDEQMEEEEEESEEESGPGKALDPRAGRVNVELAPLPVEGKNFAEMLRKILVDSQTHKSSRTRMLDLINSFEKLDSGTYPYKLKDLQLPNDSSLKVPKANKAALELMQFEKTVVDENEDEQLKGLNKRQKRRIMAKQRKKRLRINDTINISSPPKKSKHGDTDTKNKGESKKQKSKHIISEEKKQSPVNSFKTKDARVKLDKKIKHETQSNMRKDCPFISTKQSPKKENISTEDNIVSKENSKSFTKIDKKIIKKRKKIPSGIPLKNIENAFKATKDTGNVETEIFIPVPNIVKKINKSSNVTTPVHTISNKSNKITTPVSKKPNTPGTGSGKKVNIALSKNTSHTVIDYFKSIRQSPNIPYDGEKKPAKTSLKPNTMPSPVNPFYRKKMSLSFS